MGCACSQGGETRHTDIWWENLYIEDRERLNDGNWIKLSGFGIGGVEPSRSATIVVTTTCYPFLGIIYTSAGLDCVEFVIRREKSHSRHVCNCRHVNNIHTEFVDMFMKCLHAELHIFSLARFLGVFCHAHFFLKMDENYLQLTSQEFRININGPELHS
jgi:hypothetical protein